MLFVASLLFIAAVELPEDELWHQRQLELEAKKNHRKMYGRGPDVTQTGCTVVEGGSFPKTTASSPDPVNEPCYVHDAACVGYPVCCVTMGTCVSTHGGMVSSNAKYYDGGCVSPNSRAGALPDGCSKQGECHAMYLEHMKNGTAGPGIATGTNPYAVQHLMEGASECDSFWSPPLPIWAIIVIAAVAGLVVLVLLLIICKFACGKSSGGGKGAPDDGAASSA